MTFRISSLAAMVFDPATDALAVIAAASPTAPQPGVPLGPLRLIDPVTGTLRTLLDGAVIACFWSPDGQTIAALRLLIPSGAPVARAGGLVLAATHDKYGQAGSPAPSAGTAVGLDFIHVASGLAQREQVVHLTDTLVSQLLPYFDQYALSHPLWSPDGRSIVLPLVDSAGQDELMVMPADGSAPHAVAPGAVGFWGP